MGLAMVLVLCSVANGKIFFLLGLIFLYLEDGTIFPNHPLLLLVDCENGYLLGSSFFFCGLEGRCRFEVQEVLQDSQLSGP